MLISQLIITPLMILLAWGHVHMHPSVARSGAMRLFDGTVIALGIGLCTLACQALSDLPLEGNPAVRRPVFPTLSTFVVFPAVLFLGWWLRERFSRA